MSQREEFSGYALFLVCIVALGGFLFGYNTGVISGSLLFIAKEFSLSRMEEGFLVSIILIGGLVGAAGGGVLSDRLGRRKTILVTTLLFVIGIGIAAASKTYDFLVIGRIVTGLAIGITSIATPLYLAEIAPPHRRGACVAVNQLAITVGIVIAYSVNFILAGKGDWRWMLAFGMVPAIIQFFAMLFLPESPSWLMANKHTRQACGVMKRIRKNSFWIAHVPEMEHVAHEKIRWKDLFFKPLLKPLIVGVGISIFQIISGINTVVYYAPKILQSSTTSNALMGTILIGVINVLATFTALCLMDRTGRRKLLLIGTSGMVLGLVVLIFSTFLHVPEPGWFKLGAILFYVLFFALSLGPVTWVLISEIYPLRIRGRAMGIAIFANWLANYLVSLFFLDLLAALTLGGVFAVFAVVCLLAFWFIYSLVPETKGKSLEAIEESLK